MRASAPTWQLSPHEGRHGAHRDLPSWADSGNGTETRNPSPDRQTPPQTPETASLTLPEDKSRPLATGNQRCYPRLGRPRASSPGSHLQRPGTNSSGAMRRSHCDQPAGSLWACFTWLGAGRVLGCRDLPLAHLCDGTMAVCGATPHRDVREWRVEKVIIMHPSSSKSPLL